jgi:transposase
VRACARIGLLPIYSDGELIGRMPGEPLIEERKWLQAMINSRRRGRPSTNRYLGSGVVRCGRCGKPMGADQGIKVRIARRGVEDKTRIGRHRWDVERTVSWLLRFKRLGLRYDRTEGTLRPLLLLAVSIINLRRLVSITDSETRS